MWFFLILYKFFLRKELPHQDVISIIWVLRFLFGILIQYFWLAILGIWRKLTVWTECVPTKLTSCLNFFFFCRVWNSKADAVWGKGNSSPSTGQNVGVAGGSGVSPDGAPTAQGHPPAAEDRAVQQPGVSALLHILPQWPREHKGTKLILFWSKKTLWFEAGILNMLVRCNLQCVGSRNVLFFFPGL